MGRRRGLGGIVAVLSVVLMPALLGSCGSVECSQTGPAPATTTFVGRATAVHGEVADFSVESVQTPVGQAPAAHTPAVGDAVVVHYASDDQRFLRVHDRYRVLVNWEGAQYESDVHTAEDCSPTSGTTHADGTPIDTARVPWLRVHRTLVALALAPVVALAIVGAVLGYRRRTGRRRG